MPTRKGGKKLTFLGKTTVEMVSGTDQRPKRYPEYRASGQ